MKAVLAQVRDINIGIYIADSSCGISTFLFGCFAPSSPVVIRDETKGLEVEFNITNGEWQSSLMEVEEWVDFEVGHLVLDSQPINLYRKFGLLFI